MSDTPFRGCNDRGTVNFTRVKLKDARLNDRTITYLKNLTQKPDPQDALDQYMKWTGWYETNRLVNGHLKMFYCQTTVESRLRKAQTLGEVTTWVQK
jgi:hypothetical protein